MTDKEKARAYDEALKDMKAIYPNLRGDAKLAVEHAFPKLRESEDERIRKELIEAFEAYDVESSWNLIPVKHILAWLEKQKEPHYTKRNALFDECVKNCDPKVMEEVSDKVDEMLGKPSSWNSPVMTYEMIMDEQKEQKPAEWSKATINGEPISTENQSVDIPLAEWSEEDEAMRDNILRVLNCFVGTAECESTPSLSTSYLLYRREIDWLKSLRPSWKPSEEQMSMLLAVLNDPNNAGAESCQMALKSLYEQLKKLM